MVMEEPDGALFRKWRHKVATDFLMPDATPEELFVALPEKLRSFKLACELPKPGRWMAWNSCAKEQAQPHPAPPTHNILRSSIAQAITYCGQASPIPIVRSSIAHCGQASPKHRPQHIAALTTSVQTQEQFPEYNASRMLFEFVLGIEPTAEISDDQAQESPTAELRRLKANAGGVQLCSQIMTDSVLRDAKYLYIVLQPLWSWYTEKVTEHVGPAQHLKWLIKMLKCGPFKFRALFVMLDCALYDRLKLQWCELEPEASAEDVLQQDQLATNMLQLTWHLLAERVWSLSMYECPPFSYAGCCSANEDLARAGVNNMRAEWGGFCTLDTLALSSDAARSLKKQLQPLTGKPYRLTCCFFERDRWSLQSVSGQRLLRGQLEIYPHNKPAEDTHLGIRTETAANKNRMLSVTRAQAAAMKQKPISDPDVEVLSVGREQFIGNYVTTKDLAFCHRARASTHKLPETYTHIMKPNKFWFSTNPAGLKIAYAAWAWLVHCNTAWSRGQSMAIDASIWSALFAPFICLVNLSTKEVFASMGHRRFAVRAWRLRQLAPGLYTFQRQPQDRSS